MSMSSKSVTPDRLTPNPKAFINIIKVPNIDKDVSGLKPPIVSEERVLHTYQKIS